MQKGACAQLSVWHTRRSTPTQYDVSGAWLENGVREVIEKLHFENKQSGTAITIAVHKTDHLKNWTFQRLRQHVNSHLGHIRERRYGTAAKVTKAQVEEAVKLLPTTAAGQEDPNTVLLLEKVYDPQFCVVFSSPAWLRNVRLQGLESKTCWAWVDGTGKLIWQKCRILILGSLTTTHKVLVYALAIAPEENKEAYTVLFRAVNNAVEALFLCSPPGSGS